MRRLGRWLGRLSRHNDRDWFRANRAEYDELRPLFLADLDRLGRLLADIDPELPVQTGRQAAYRIYRDTRFSPDKTPFKTFFSAGFARGGRGSRYAGYYVHVDMVRPSEAGIFGGLWQPESAVLKKLRRAIVDNIEEWEEIVADARRAGLELWTSGTLKTAPQGWPKDHPAIEWLRMKDYGLTFTPAPGFWDTPDWPERLAQAARPMVPFNRFLNYSIDEPDY